MMEKWLLDASATVPEEDLRGWCPVEQDEDGNFGDVMTGLLMVTDKPPGEVVGVFHPDGQDTVDEWTKEHDEYLQRVFAEVRA